MRRLWLPLLLALALVVSSGFVAAGALATGTDDGRGEDGGSGLRTKVLSARRAPELLSRTVAHVRSLFRAVLEPK